MSTLGNAFADTSYVDGVVFKFDLRGADVRQQTISDLRARLRGYANHLDEKSFNAKFKPQIYYMDKERYRAIVKVTIYSDVAAASRNLPAGYIAYVTEAHLKAHMFSFNDPDLDSLREALKEEPEGGQQLSLFGPKNEVHKTKGDGKGWRIGDRNSRFHFASYKRRGQRPGLEVRVGRDPVVRVRNEVLDLSTGYGLNDVKAWDLLFTKLAKIGGDRFAHDMELKQMAACNFFSGFTSDFSEHKRTVEYVSLNDGQWYSCNMDTGEFSELRTDAERPA